jgi:hypothetical protein
VQNGTGFRTKALCLCWRKTQDAGHHRRKPDVSGQGGAGSRYSHDPREGARVPACMDILRKTIFWVMILLLFCLVQFGGRGAEKLGPMAGQTAHKRKRPTNPSRAPAAEAGGQGGRLPWKCGTVGGEYWGLPVALAVAPAP